MERSSTKRIDIQNSMLKTDRFLPFMLKIVLLIDLILTGGVKFFLNRW